MEFIVTNFLHPKAKQAGDAYFAGPSCDLAMEGAGCVSIYCGSSSPAASCAGQESWPEMDIQQPLSREDFYLAAMYDKALGRLYVQTDIVAYYGCYLYMKDGVTALSDDIHALLLALGSIGVKPMISETRVREELYFAKLPLGETVFPDISLLLPASVYTIDIKAGKANCVTYNTLRLTQEIHTVEEAAQALYDAIDGYFAYKNKEGTIWGLGLSGGLDSRVAGWFACKHGYKIEPYFLGVGRNALGIKTNDYKRSIEVSHALGLTKARVFDPRQYPLRRKLENEFAHMPLPLFNSNVPQNCGYKGFGFFDTLIHGMYGGELFGQILPAGIAQMDELQLTRSIQQYYCSHPKYRVYFRELSMNLLNRLGLLAHFACADPEFRSLLSQEQEKAYFERTLQWVRVQKQSGLSNANILMKDFLARAHVVKHAYYATLGGEKPAMGVYLNPAVIRCVLSWEDGLLFERKVQFALLRRLGNLAEVRGQAYWIYAGQKSTGKAAVLGARVMHYVRGNGMEYGKWFSQREIGQCWRECTQGSTLCKRIRFDPAFQEQMYNRTFDLVRLAMLEKAYSLPIGH